MNMNMNIQCIMFNEKGLIHNSRNIKKSEIKIIAVVSSKMIESIFENTMPFDNNNRIVIIMVKDKHLLIFSFEWLVNMYAYTFKERFLI